jgi:hypothetical protein
MDHLHRAGDRVAAVMRPRAVARRAVHAHQDIDAAAVAEVDLQAGAAEDRHLGPHALAFHHAADGIVPAGLARGAAEEDEPAAQRHAGGGDRLHRQQHGRHVSLLLGGALAQHRLAGQAVRTRIDDVAGVGVRHRRLRLVHRVGDQHQRMAGSVLALLRDQVAHAVAADAEEAEGGQPRRDGRVDEGAQQRLGFQEFRLGRGHAHQLDQQPLRTVQRDQLVELRARCCIGHRALP